MESGVTSIDFEEEKMLTTEVVGLVVVNSLYGDDISGVC